MRPCISSLTFFLNLVQHYWRTHLIKQKHIYFLYVSILRIICIFQLCVIIRLFYCTWTLQRATYLIWYTVTSSNIFLVKITKCFACGIIIFCNLIFEHELNGYVKKYIYWFDSTDIKTIRIEFDDILRIVVSLNKNHWHIAV